jgi:hypothetical protein
MTDSAFDERSEALALAHGLGWPIDEDRIIIRRADFLDDDGFTIAQVFQGEGTKRSRAFLQAALEQERTTLDRKDRFIYPDKSVAEEFYGPKLWNDPILGPDHHSAVYGAKNCVRIRVVFKTISKARHSS